MTLAFLPPPEAGPAAPEADLASAFAALLVDLQRADGATPELAEALHRAARAASLATSAGHACVLPQELAAAGCDATVLRRSRLVGEGSPATPLVLDGAGRLYLHRYWDHERRLAAHLAALDRDVPLGTRAARDAVLDRLFPPQPGRDDAQREAAARALERRLTVISGGPGSGKTTTVARLIGALALLAPGLRVALAAPTGKAAARLQQAIRSLLEGEPALAGVADRLPGEAHTLHRLLGWRPGRRGFRHGADDPLAHDVVVVDEASMLDLALAARLLEALPEGGRLILVGDRDQLASVEAGAVLGDIVAGGEAGGPLQDRIVTLKRVHRYGEEIAALAEAVRTGDAERVLELLEAGGEAITWIDADPAEPASSALLAPVREATVAAGRAAYEAAIDGDAATALEAIGRHRILCAHRRGPHGVRRWNQQAESWLAEEVDGFAPYGRWYIGRPLLITENEYELKLFNGDTGIIIRGPDGTPLAAFRRGDEIIELSPTRLDAVETVYAMTIHKSQGSQFDAVSVLLPPEGSRILTRELLYTAVTRSRKRLQLCGPSATMRSAATHAIARASGLIRRMPTRPSRRARLPRP